MDQLVNEFIMYIQQNEIEKANVVFEKILGQLEKEDAQIMAQTGYSLAQLGFVDYANEIYTVGEDRFPEEDSWILLKGELALDNGQVEESIDELLKITPESPLYVDALLLQADAYQMYNLPEVALVKLSEARELAPNQPVILYGIAELRFQQGEFQQALPLYERLLQSEETPESLFENIEAHFAYAKAATGDFEEAIELIEATPENDRTDEQQEQLAFYYVETENFEKANTILEALYEDDKLSDGLLAVFAQVKNAFHDHDGALEMIDKAILVNPYEARLYFQKAEFAQQIGNRETAREALELALDIDPDYGQALVLLLQLLIDDEDYGTARALIQDMDEKGIEFDRYVWMKAKVFQELEEFDFANQAYTDAYPQLKEDTSFLHDYFDFLREAGDWRRIEAIFKEQSDLAQRPEFQDVYESLQDWLAENEGF
ncbi:MAG: hypothetical protein B7Z25_02790 [Aerococcus viridans]|nr:MAG: hypothetical protein B7Z25_02790 [Aerococcus viridans]